MSVSTINRRPETTTHATRPSDQQQRTERADRRITGFLRLTLTILVVLFPQYALGMLINLFIQFPSALPGGNAWPWAMSKTTLIPLHVYLGILLVVLALVALGFAIASRRLVALAGSSIGLALIVLAWISGEAFLADGQQNALSFSMALGFLGALITYALTYYVTQRKRA